MVLLMILLLLVLVRRDGSVSDVSIVTIVADWSLSALSAVISRRIRGGAVLVLTIPIRLRMLQLVLVDLILLLVR